MGAVTSTLERMVIDVAWSCHEWFYGSATGGAGTCNNPRPAITRRRCRHNMPSSSSSGSSSSDGSGPSGATAPAIGGSSGSLRRRAQLEKLTSLPAVATAALLPPPPPPPPTATTACRGAPTFPFPAAGASATSASSDDDWAPPPRRPARHDLEAWCEPQPRRRATMSLMYPGSRRHHHDALGPVPRQPRRPNVPYSTLQAQLFRCTAARNGCLSSKDCSKDKQAYPVRRLGRSWSVHNATANRAATL